MSNLDDINLQIMKNKISFYDHNLNILNDKYKGNQTFDIIMSRFKKYMDCINKLLCQVSITTDKQIKEDLLDTASKMICSNINDLYLIISNILVTNDNKLHRILDGISLKLKKIFNIKTDVIILDGTDFFSTLFFTTKYTKLSLDAMYTININSSLDILGVPQIAHEFGHIHMDADQDIYKNLFKEIHHIFSNSSLDYSKEKEKIEELTCDIFAAHTFGLSFAYSYILSFNYTFNEPSSFHFDDYFRIKFIMRYLNESHNTFINNFIATYKNQSNDYRKYNNIVDILINIYRNFFEGKFSKIPILEKENQILNLWFEKLFDPKNNLKFNDIINSAKYSFNME